MKKIYQLTILFVFSFLVSSAQQQDTLKGAMIKFDSETIDYQSIPAGSNEIRYMRFTNTGNDTLHITTSKASCGCALATILREKIPPGEYGFLKFRYDTKRIGGISTVAMIKSNAINKPKVVIRVIGQIYKRQ
jgi:hypothetical protein